MCGDAADGTGAARCDEREPGPSGAAGCKTTRQDYTCSRRTRKRVRFHRSPRCLRPVSRANSIARRSSVC